MERELEFTRKEIKLLADNVLSSATYVDLIEEMIALAHVYIQQGVLTEKSINDPQHIAIATVVGASAIIS